MGSGHSARAPRVAERVGSAWGDLKAGTWVVAAGSRGSGKVSLRRGFGGGAFEAERRTCAKALRKKCIEDTDSKSGSQSGWSGVSKWGCPTNRRRSE